MKSRLHLLYLDRYHQGDPLFLKELAQRFARAGAGQIPALILHTSGEKLERTLEAQGVFPERREGVVQTRTPRHAALAERAAREANQELVALFTDEEVAAVGLQGADRGLLRRTDGGEVRARALGWVADLVKMRVVPVVSALAEGPEGPEEVPAARAAVALAGALGAFDVRLCFLTKGALKSDRNGARPEGPLTTDALPEGGLSEPETVRRAAQRHGEVLLTDLSGFFADGGPQGRSVKSA